MKQEQELLKPFELGNLILKNRIVMAPMTRSRANNSQRKPNDIMVEYYRQRSSAGLIISEATQVSERGIGYINTPGIHTDAQVEGWKKITEAVHEEGGKIFIQLWHCGRMSHPKFHDGDKPLAPSAVNPNSKSFTPDGLEDTVEPKEMTIAEIHETVYEFKKAAENAKEAGFDGIELHASNGYLIHQFFNENANIRTDDYGGSIKNRSRLLFEIIEAVCEVWDENRIGVRLNPSLHENYGIMASPETIPTFEHIVHKLNAYDLAYLHFTEPPASTKEIDFLVPDIARHFRPLYSGTLMINGGFDQEKGNRIIEEGLADLVAYARLFISNPDLPQRFENNSELQEWDKETFYTTGEKGYIDYPGLKEETVNR